MLGEDIVWHPVWRGKYETTKVLIIVHCDYPHWIKILCHDINVHIPHHISQKIPSYNLRLAHDSLRKNWGKYLNEAKWDWRLMKTIMTKCHIYDEENNYVAFDEGVPEESKIIGFVRRMMPNIAWVAYVSLLLLLNQCRYITSRVGFWHLWLSF